MNASVNYRPIHSDYIVHWTGKDIDTDDAVWQNTGRSTPPKHIADRYFERLKSILRFGMWMTRDLNEEQFTIGGLTLDRPTPYRTCFTELRLSEARSHARAYGRLGIGFKRFYLFDRMGGPMAYYQESRLNWHCPPFVAPPCGADSYRLCYLKPMTEPHNGILHYKYYDESEWRIIFDDHIANMMRSKGHEDTASRFVPIDKVDDADLRAAVTRAACRPGYLLPVRDKWFSIIIYPSISLKVRAAADDEVRRLLTEIKPKISTNDIAWEANPAPLERSNPPIELDLDACQHF